MTRTVCGLIVTTSLFALLGLGSPAVASVVVEAEADGTAVNNTVGTAQAIPSSAFTTPVPATVFNPPGFPTVTITGASGADDVDFYSFTAAGGSLLLDIDNDTVGGFDTQVALFSGTGTLLAFGDDSFPADPGSASAFNSFVGAFTLPGPGTYFVAVSDVGNNPVAFSGCTSFTSLFRPDGAPAGFSFGGCPAGATYQNSGLQEGLDYTLHISLSPLAATVPMPGTLALLVSAVTGLGAVRARRRR